MKNLSGDANWFSEEKVKEKRVTKTSEPIKVESVEIPNFDNLNKLISDCEKYYNFKSTKRMGDVLSSLKTSRDYVNKFYEDLKLTETLTTNFKLN